MSTYKPDSSRQWRGRSYKKGGKRVRDLKEAPLVEEDSDLTPDSGRDIPDESDSKPRSGMLSMVCTGLLLPGSLLG